MTSRQNIETKVVEGKIFQEKELGRDATGELASRTRSIVDEMLWAQFHFGLSVRSVKVVRHKRKEYFVRGCGKATPGMTASRAPWT